MDVKPCALESGRAVCERYLVSEEGENIKAPSQLHSQQCHSSPGVAGVLLTSLSVNIPSKCPAQLSLPLPTCRQQQGRGWHH